MREALARSGRAMSLAALLALGVSAGTTGVAAAQASDLPPHFAPLAFLVGGCWRGTFADGKTTDFRCVEPVFGGKFLRERHVVGRPGRDDYHGEALYHWDAKDQKIRYTYWNSSGGVSTGTMEVEGTHRVFPAESYKGPDGRMREFRTSWHVISDAAWVMVTEERRPGHMQEWTEAWRVSFEREASARLPNP